MCVIIMVVLFNVNNMEITLEGIAHSFDSTCDSISPLRSVRSIKNYFYKPFIIPLGEFMKKMVTLYLEEALKDKTKELGINLSGFIERKLQEYIRINDPEIALAENVNQFGVSQSNVNRIPRIPSFSKYKREYEKWLISRK